jgi:hypothetical protein
MRSFQEYLTEATAAKKKAPEKKSTPKKDTSSNKIKAMQSLVNHLRSVLGDYDIVTRRFIWERLTNSKGHELMEKILRNPKTYLSMSEFTQLVTKK